VAIYHLSMKVLTRSDGKSAVAAAAYRAGEKIKDERSGTMHDYTRKRNVITSALILPDGVTCEMARAELWNRAEAAEKRKNSCIAREIEVALPAKLPQEAQIRLATQYAQDIADRYGLAADVAVHAAAHGGDERNVHAHILLTTRRIAPTGQLTDKARELDDYKTRTAELDYIRTHWAYMCNIELENYGIAERVDHRTLSAQGIDRAPQIHVGVHATQMERRGIATERGELNRQREKINNGIERMERTIAAAEKSKQPETPAEAARTPEKGAISIDMRKYTPTQVSAAQEALAGERKAIIDRIRAERRNAEAEIYARLDKDITDAQARYKTIDEAEPRKRLLETRRAYDERRAAWEKERHAAQWAIRDAEDKRRQAERASDERHNAEDFRRADERARRLHPTAAQIVDWAEQKRQAEIDEAKRKIAKRKEQERQRGRSARGRDEDELEL
jgi:hypothetical protein